MKNKTIQFVSFAFVLAGSIVAFIGASQSPVIANESVKAHSVVVLSARTQWICVNQGIGGGDVCSMTDFVIYCASSSAGAPLFHTTNQYELPSLAHSLAALLDQGFHIEHTDNLTYTMVR